ncbi:hypothetical protein [Idiomarina abyssalis]|uniref:hypothetical protein n=1 Tax=Idiomarina abyssalis TaxID=86102 RepID=UPI003A9370A0
MATLRVDAVGGAGFVPDVEPWQLPASAWTFLQDVSVSENSLREPLWLTETIADSDAVPADPFLNVFLHQSQGVFWYILCTARKVYVSRGRELIDITPAGKVFRATLQDRWQASSLNGFLILNNTWDEPHYWALEAEPGSEAPLLAPLSSYPGESPWTEGQSCEFIVGFNNSLFAGNLKNSSGTFPFLVAFSDFAEPGTLPQKWAAAPDNSAGRRDLAEGQDAIVGALPYKDVLFVRKRNSVYMFKFTGGQFVYQRVVQTDQVSLINRHCMVNTDRFQIAVGDNDIMVTQGQAHESVVHNKTKRWFFDNLNKARLDQVFCLHFSLENEIWILAPQGEAELVNVALIWNYVNNTFTTRSCRNVYGGTEGYGIDPKGFYSWLDLDPRTWLEWDDVWGLASAEINQKRLLLTQGQNAGQTRRVLVSGGEGREVDEPEAYLERMHIPFPRGEIMDWESRKQIASVTPKFSLVDPSFYMDIWLGTQDESGLPIKWHGPKRWVPGKKGVFFDKSGRFISLYARVSSGQKFRLTGYDIEYKLTSKR